MSPTANKDIACLLLVSSLDAKVATGARATDFTERCCFKLSVLETDAFADKSMVDWTIEAILFVVVRSALIYMPTFGRPVLPFSSISKIGGVFSSRVFLFLAFFKFLGDRRFEIFFFVSFFVQVGFHHLALLREGGVSKKSVFVTP